MLTHFYQGFDDRDAILGATLEAAQQLCVWDWRNDLICARWLMEGCRQA